MMFIYKDSSGGIRGVLRNTKVPPPILNTYWHDKFIFELVSGLVLRKNSTELLSGLGKSHAFPSRGKGLLLEGGSYLN